MNLELLPEYRMSEFLNSIGAFDPDSMGDSYQEQLSFFDEDRLDKDERALVVFNEGENTNVGSLYEDINILLVFVSKARKGDGVEANMFARSIQDKIEQAISYDDIFSMVNRGLGSAIFLESGRQAFELRIQMKSNYCGN